MTRRVLVQIPQTGKVFEVQGRAARMVLEIIAHQDGINTLRVGRVVLSFIDSKVVGRLVDAWHPVKEGDDAA